MVTATSFPGFSPTRPTERERGRVGENPGNEVVVTAVNEGWQKISHFVEWTLQVSTTYRCVVW